MTEQLERAQAALWGLAIGDALGMPTQMMSREAVQLRYGRIDGFRSAAEDHPLAHGMTAGSVTDDTQQAMLVGRHLVAHSGHIDPDGLAAELIAWEDDMRKRGSLDLLGPSTKAAVASIVAGGSVDDAGRYGTTNGAAMRVTPVGIMMPSDDLGSLVERVAETSRVTHNTGLAIAGASAVAAAVSAAIDGRPLEELFALAIRAAELGATRGHWIAGADVARRIEWALSIADRADRAGAEDELYRAIGTSLATQESVPVAFGILSLYRGEPWAACCAAASLGGDSDTVAAMVGAIAGASCGNSGFPERARETIRQVNGFGPAPLASELIGLR